MKKLFQSTEQFVAVLVSEQASAELGQNASAYEPMIGSWAVTVLDHIADEKTLTTRGEWNFAWILEGRAIQDVFMVPQLSERHVGMSKLYNRYGTTIRIFDETIQKWKIFWFNPVNGAQNELEVTVLPDRIVQLGKDSSGNLMRWIFTEIKPDSFKWSGELSKDAGQSWALQAEFFAVRK